MATEIAGDNMSDTSEGDHSQSAAADAQPSTTCCFLDKTPAKIRNYIYELAFTTDTDGPIDLHGAAPPSKSLILACRQIHSEARLLYRDAYRAYWKGEEFFVDRRNVSLPEDIDSLREEDLQRISQLSVIACSDTKLTTFKVLDVYGVWRFTYQDKEYSDRGHRDRDCIGVIDQRGWHYHISEQAARVRCQAQPEKASAETQVQARLGWCIQ